MANTMARRIQAPLLRFIAAAVLLSIPACARLDDDAPRQSIKDTPARSAAQSVADETKPVRAVMKAPAPVVKAAATPAPAPAPIARRGEDETIATPRPARPSAQPPQMKPAAPQTAAAPAPVPAAPAAPALPVSPKKPASSVVQPQPVTPVAATPTPPTATPPAPGAAAPQPGSPPAPATSSVVLCRIVDSCRSEYMALVDDLKLAWVKQQPTPLEFARGLRVLAYRAVRPKLDCPQLGDALQEMQWARETFSKPVDGVSTLDAGRLLNLVGEVRLALDSEHRRRCPTSPRP